MICFDNKPAKYHTTKINQYFRNCLLKNHRVFLPQFDEYSNKNAHLLILSAHLVFLSY